MMIIVEKNNLEISFKYDKLLINKIKGLPIYKFDPDFNRWIVPITYKKELMELFPDVPITIPQHYNSYMQDNTITQPSDNKLYDYQYDAVKKFLKHGDIILNMDLGTGKTPTAIISAIASEFSDILVIVRASTIKQWEQEITKFAPGCEDRFKVMSYEKLRNGLKNGLKKRWNMVIFDEVSKIKNFKTALYKEISQMKIRHKILITGIIMENHIEEIYTMLSFFNPNIFLHYTDFKDRYLIMDEDAMFPTVKGYKNIALLKQKLDEVRYTASGDKILEPVIYNRFLKLKTHDQKLYSDYKKKLAEYETIPIEKIQYLKQMAVSPYLVGVADTGVKLEELHQIIQKECEGKKTMVFCCYKKIHPILKTTYPNADFISADNKYNPTADLVFTTDCFAYGMNLQDYEVLINLDIPWNPALLKQRIGRIVRIGQKKTPIIYNLIIEKTIDEYIIGKLNKKLNLIDQLQDFKVIDYIKKYL